ncbi:MAG: Zn-ribbon domain-containing OB-fold protein [Acidimicrobiia bacterium]
MSDAPEKPFRILPKVNDRNRHFWEGGRDGHLVFQRCQECSYYIHPPAPMCPQCHSKNTASEPVSGRATVASYTVNHQNWMPGPPLPYVVALVEIEEQPSVRLTTNIYDVDPDDVHIGMPVEVLFEEHDDGQGAVWIPLFRPRGEARA